MAPGPPVDDDCRHHRRDYLAALAAGATGGLAGCGGFIRTGPTPTPAGRDPLYPDDRTVPDRSDTYHLFVENLDETAHALTISVARTGDERFVWRAEYEVPGGHGFEIPDLFVEGRSYRVTVDLAGDDRVRTVRTMYPCPGWEGGSRNLAIWIEAGEMAFEQDNCDEVFVGKQVPIADHATYRRTDGA